MHGGMIHRQGEWIRPYQVAHGESPVTFGISPLVRDHFRLLRGFEEVLLVTELNRLE